jgi:hypothetical protein
MAEEQFLPGQKADCSKCGGQVTLFPKHGWVHTDGTTAKHPIRGVSYDPDDLITPEDSANFIDRLIKTANARKVPGRSRAKKAERVIPTVDPHSPSKYGVRTTANCKVCHTLIKTVAHPETGERVWVHTTGPKHEEAITESPTSVRAAQKTDEEKALLKPGKVGKPKGDSVTGEITIPGRPAKGKWDPAKGEVAIVDEGREAETVQGDPDYIDAEGRLTSRREAELSKASRVDRNVILKGEKHLEDDHPWIGEDSLHPEKQNIDTIVHPTTGRIIRANLEAAPRGDIFTTSGTSLNADPTQIPVRETAWKTGGSAVTKRGTVAADIQVKKRLKSYIDLAHWHKSTFDKDDKYEYQVYTDQGVGGDLAEPRIGVRRRLKYCNKCAPVLLQDGSIPHANTDPRLPRVQNSGQSFVRPEPKDLPEGTKPWVRTLPSGKISVGVHPNAVGIQLIRGAKSAMKEEIAQTGNAKLDGFTQGSGEGKQ